MILLDTHAWVWFFTGDKRMEKMIGVIDKAVNEDALFVSAISCWEISMLAAKGKLIFKKNALSWIEETLGYGIQIIQLDPKISYESCNLPSDFHGDPADRIIIATAHAKDATLVTADREIIRYAKKVKMKIIELKS